MLLSLTCRIAEALVHEICEIELGFSHDDAAIAELLVSSKIELEVPVRIKHQLDISPNEKLHEILVRRDDELLRHLCLGLVPDVDWESLPNDVRVMLLKRVTSSAYEVNGSNLQWIESNVSNPTCIPYETYLARQDLHTRLCLLIDDSAAVSLDLTQDNGSTRRKISVDIAREVELEVAPDDGSGFCKMFLSPFSHIWRFSRTVPKFFVLAFIAEPEYQRELAYVLSGTFLKIPIRFVATRVWIYARWIQDFLLSFFLVRFLAVTLTLSSIIART